MPAPSCRDGQAALALLLLAVVTSAPAWRVGAAVVIAVSLAVLTVCLTFIRPYG